MYRTHKNNYIYVLPLQNDSDTQWNPYDNFTKIKKE